MSRTHRIIATRVLAFAFVASAMIAAPHHVNGRTTNLHVSYDHGMSRQ